jgi:hypothetical protein
MSSQFFETDPALKDAFEALKGGCEARDPERIQTGMRAYLGHVQRVGDAFQPGHHATLDGWQQDLSDVWDLLHELTPLGAGLAEDTLVPGMQAWVTEALNAFCQALVEHSPTWLGDRWCDEASEEHWALDWTNGSPAASLRLYFARWAIYPSLPSRMGYIIPAVCLYDRDTVMDSPLRTLQRTLLFVAAVCRFETVDKEWHERVRLAAGDDILGDLDESWDVDDFLKMLSGKEEWHDIKMDPLKDSLSREMVLAMLMARRAGKRLKPPLEGAQLDALTHAAGASYIGELYLHKWRRVGRCWRARAAAIRWHRQVRAKLRAARLKRVRVAVLVRLFALRLHRRVEATRRTEREADWAAACADNPIVGGQPGLFHAVFDWAWEAGRVRGLKRMRPTTGRVHRRVRRGSRVSR